jgi:hypothetical protein
MEALMIESDIEDQEERLDTNLNHAMEKISIQFFGNIC